MPDLLEQLAEAHAHHRAGRTNAAEGFARAVLQAEPCQPMALHLAGVLALQAGRAGEAVHLLRRALAVRPQNTDTALALADALAAAGQPRAAFGYYRQVLSAQPRRPEALTNLARLLCRAGKPRAGAACCRKALAASPEFAPARSALAACLLEANEPAAAEEMADLSLAAAPGDAEAWFVRGTAASALGDYARAMVALRHAVRLRPGDARSRLNLGNALSEADELEQAEWHLRKAVALDPGLPEARASLGFVLTSLGRLDDAAAACDAAIRLRPDFARAYWNRSFARLLAGDYPNGWADYEWRRRDLCFAAGIARPPGREWQGEPLAGRRLLVLASQGLGDTIQFARFLPALARQAASVTLACAAPLVPLLRQLPVRVIDRNVPLPTYDLWIDQMSLPHRLGLRVDSIPGATGYLTACGVRVSEAPSVGVVWAGNPAHSNDRRRSMPLEALAPLLRVPGIAFTSLQVGPAAPCIEQRFGIADNARALRDFAATARVIAALDLVIAVDTATAHLAGALGTPVWLMLPYAPDWRWMTQRPDSPWYASARLFRQHRPGDWAGVVAQVVGALVRLRPPARSSPPSSARTGPAP